MKPDTPRFLSLVLEHARAVGFDPGVHLVEVRHDGTCAFLAGTGPCDCSPLVLSGPGIDRRYRLNRRERRRRRRSGNG